MIVDAVVTDTEQLTARALFADPGSTAQPAYSIAPANARASLRAINLLADEPESPDTHGADSISTEVGEQRQAITRLANVASSRLIGTAATVLQLWEGTVVRLAEDGTLQVNLRDKANKLPPHYAEFDVANVDVQDRPLIKPGAVFYWTMYRTMTIHGTVETTQKIRFRRLPAWTRAQVRKIRESATALASTFR